MSIYENSPDARHAPHAEPTRFRPRYRQLTPEELALHDEIKDKAAELEKLFDRTHDGRYKALAITSLEQSVMWIIKGLTQ